MTLTAVLGIRVGHWQNAAAQTGCTVVLCPEPGCVASGDVRGSAPGTREAALLAPEKTVQQVQAVLLTGGSAFGLSAATGVMRYLEAHKRGFATPFGAVPIVPAAALFDLSRGDPSVRPDAEAGYRACQAATTDPVQQGRIGAGAGASCGKYLGFERAQASGLGSASVEVGGAVVAALAVANPVGDIVDPDTGQVVAGIKDETGTYLGRFTRAPFDAAGSNTSNTTLVVVATDAPIDKAEAKALAGSAHVGIGRVTRPSHTVSDGDTTFCLSTGTGPRVPLMLLSVAVQEVVAAAILSGVRAAQS